MPRGITDERDSADRTVTPTGNKTKMNGFVEISTLLIHSAPKQKSNEWMHLSPFYTRMHGEWLRYAKSTSQFHWRFLLVRDVQGFQVNPLCRYDITRSDRQIGNWTVAQWSKVLFSDESKFCVSFGNQGPRVWKKGGEAHSPICLKSSVKFPQSVMIWGAMSSAGVGPFCFLKTNTAPAYQEILEHFMLPSADQIFKDADFIFQQDLAPAHTAKSTKKLVK